MKELKLCVRCHAHKNTDLFAKTKSGVSQIRRICLECEAEEDNPNQSKCHRCDDYLPVEQFRLINVRKRMVRRKVCIACEATNGRQRHGKVVDMLKQHPNNRLYVVSAYHGQVSYCVTDFSKGREQFPSVRHPGCIAAINSGCLVQEKEGVYRAAFATERGFLALPAAERACIP